MSILDLFKAKAADVDNVRQPDSSQPEFWRDPFKPLRAKWKVIPLACQERARIGDVMDLSDEDLLRLWNDALREQLTVRGWYHELYDDAVCGKKVLDIGAGLGFDSITFARHGAEVTFVDLVPATLQVLKRLCGLMGICNAQFVVLETLQSLETLPTDFDIIMAIGSLINAPFEVIRAEVQELIKHLKVGGRWLHFAYPKCRWEREGALPFHVWGTRTDGPGTPWMEWYDTEKMLRLFEPCKIELLFTREWHNSDFNWFDFVYRGR